MLGARGEGRVAIMGGVALFFCCSMAERVRMKDTCPVCRFVPRIENPGDSQMRLKIRESPGFSNDRDIPQLMLNGTDSNGWELYSCECAFAACRLFVAGIFK